MGISLATAVALMCVLAHASAKNNQLLTDEFIAEINSKQNSWKAGRNFPINTPMKHIKILTGVLQDDHTTNPPVKKYDADVIASLPETFDPRDKWPYCLTLNDIRDQGKCSSGWALSAVAAMTDRYCIQSNGTQHFYFSVQDVMTCCYRCFFPCFMGYPYRAWAHWQTVGIVSGGGFNSSQGCRPYTFPPCDHHIQGKGTPCKSGLRYPPCINRCENSYPVDYNLDKKYGKRIYTLIGEDDMKADLFNNGPIEATLYVYADLLSYKSGVYVHVSGNKLGGHAVKILGWGVENGTKYWLVANSWNTDWGDNGFFKILRGEDHCSIESYSITGIPLY